MYESFTYEFLMNRMLGRVPADVDQREGSIIYNALAPAAFEMAQMYAELDANLRLASGQTASGTYLDMRTMDYGVTRELATKAVLIAQFKDGSNAAMNVPIGNRFSAGELTFKVIEMVTTGTFKIECETAGAVGNTASGSLLPIDFVAGLASATISSIHAPGKDAESDEQLRTRYMDKVRTPSTGGNKADYRKWALEVEGVGDAQVVPLWNGPGTVKVYLLKADKTPAGTPLVDEVQDYISPVAGAGDGKAPIGADVTVVAATAVNIAVTATMTLDGSRTLSQVKADFETALIDHLNSIAFSADPAVKYVRIGSLLLDVSGVLDYAGLQVNGGTTNISIPVGSVAVKGTVTLT